MPFYPRRKMPVGTTDAEIKKRKRQDAAAERLENDKIMAERLVDSHFGRAVCACSTHAQWVTLDAALIRVNKRLKAANLDETTKPGLINWLNRVGKGGKEVLNRAGIFTSSHDSFGRRAEPLLILNPGYARALGQLPNGSAMQCTCGNAQSQHKGLFKATRASVAKGATADAGGHKANCCLWTPPKRAAALK